MHVWGYTTGDSKLEISSFRPLRHSSKCWLERLADAWDECAIFLFILYGQWSLTGKLQKKGVGERKGREGKEGAWKRSLTSYCPQITGRSWSWWCCSSYCPRSIYFYTVRNKLSMRKRREMLCEWHIVSSYMISQAISDFDEKEAGRRIARMKRKVGKMWWTGKQEDAWEYICIYVCWYIHHIFIYVHRSAKA